MEFFLSMDFVAGKAIEDKSGLRRNEMRQLEEQANRKEITYSQTAVFQGSAAIQPSRTWQRWSQHSPGLRPGAGLMPMMRLRRTVSRKPLQVRPEALPREEP